MSSKIYFSDSKKRSMGFHVIRAISSVLNKAAPRLALRQAEKLLLTPAKGRKKIAIPEQMIIEQISGVAGNLQQYRLGKGQIVILTHGWSGSASQFFPLMEKIAKAGFQAIAFDHYGHGKSSGRIANLPLFIKGINDVVTLHGKENIRCIVSHSMGTVSALNLPKDIPHVLIAPIFGFYDSLRKSVFDSGMSPALFERLLKDIERTHQIQFKDAVSEQHIGLVEQPLHIVHDEQDRFAPFAASQTMSETYPHITLYPTQGHGHGRVINSANTWLVLQGLLQQPLNNQK